MLRHFVVILLILVNFIFQSSVFPHFALGGIVPNLLIIITSAFGFMRGEKPGLLVGFACGLLCDIFYGNFLGFYALIYMYIGFLNGKFCSVFYPEDIKLPLALIITSDLSYGILYYLLVFMMRGKFRFVHYFTHIIVPEALYTIVVTLVVYPLILKIDEWIEQGKKRRF